MQQRRFWTFSWSALIRNGNPKKIKGVRRVTFNHTLDSQSQNSCSLRSRYKPVLQLQNALRQYISSNFIYGSVRKIHFSHDLHKRNKSRHEEKSSGIREEFQDEDLVSLEEHEDLDADIEPVRIIPGGAHNVFVLQPSIKWGPQKDTSTNAQLQLQECIALIDTLRWHVVHSAIINVLNTNKKQVFGKGNFEEITRQIHSLPGVSAVFLSVDRLSGIQLQELKDAWGVEILDRYTVVLEIFKEHAHTREAKMQIALAEIPYLRSRIRLKDANFDQQSGAQQYISGGGETFLEKQLRVLRDREMKITKSLQKLKKKRAVLRRSRVKQQFPVVSVVGYTNAGKTSLIRALTGDKTLQPQDQLFATLDVTAHRGVLTNGMSVIFMDTVGFISNLPHSLVASFSATLEDVLLSDVIVHIRDISHPDTVSQKLKVMQVLEELKVPTKLMDNIIEVCNKVDLLSQGEVCNKVDLLSQGPTLHGEGLMVSATDGTGLSMLRERIQESVIRFTDTVCCTLQIPLNGQHLGWLYKNATVNTLQEIEGDTEHLLVDVIMSGAADAKFKARFGDVIHRPAGS